MDSQGYASAPPYQSWQKSPAPSSVPPPFSSGQSVYSPYGQQPSQPQAGPYGTPSPSPYVQPTPPWSQQSPYTADQPPPAQSYPYWQGSYAQGRAQFPPGTDPEAVRVFQLADRDGNGLVDEIELQRVLSGFGRTPLSLRTVRLMLHLYAESVSTKIGPSGFVNLWKALKDWKVVFERFDRDRSGTIDIQELREALLSLGFAIPPAVLQLLVSKYDNTGRGRDIDYDNFIECGLIVKGLTEKFKEKDVQYTGTALLSYESFMLMVLPFIVA